MNIPGNLSEISAEMLLDYLYPELEQKWISQYKGTFYRNYSPDIMELEPDIPQVGLSRDGFLKLLPQGILANENELKDDDRTENYDEMQRRLRILKEAFLPFDVFHFRSRLAAERQLSELLNQKLTFILKHFFGIVLEEENNPYLREAAVLLPYSCSLKGDFKFVRNLLATLLECKVKMVEGRYRTNSRMEHWIPQVKYYLLIPSLTRKSYHDLIKKTTPLFHFIREWFIPFDIHCEIQPKEASNESQLNNRLILDYNAWLTI